MASLVEPLISVITGIGIAMAAGGVAIGGVLAAVYAARYGVGELLLLLRGQSDYQLASKGLEERQAAVQQDRFERRAAAYRRRLVREAYQEEFGKRRLRDHQYRY